MSVSLNLTNSDGNIQNAETLSADIGGVQVALSGSFPRDLASIHDWLKSGLDLDALVAQQNAYISGLNLDTPSGRKVQLNDTGLLISVPYQGDSNGDGIAENYFMEAQILGTHIGARGVPEWSQ